MVGQDLSIVGDRMVQLADNSCEKTASVSGDMHFDTSVSLENEKQKTFDIKQNMLETLIRSTSICGKRNYIIVSGQRSSVMPKY